MFGFFYLWIPSIITSYTTGPGTNWVNVNRESGVNYC